MKYSLPQSSAPYTGFELKSPVRTIFARKWDDPRKQLSEDRVFLAARGERFVFALIDGMGGLPSAYAAAALCGETLLERWRQGSATELVEQCNEALNNRFGVNTAGATIALACCTAGATTIAWIGDVRAYVGDERRCVTSDHSRLAMSMGSNPTGDDVRTNRKLADNLIRSLGETETLGTIPTVTAQPGEDIIFASDGAWASPSFDLMLAPSLGDVGWELDDDASVAALVFERDSTPVTADEFVLNF